MHSLAEMVERAYRLAQSLEGLTRENALASRYPNAGDYASWVLSTELVAMLDEGRASLVQQKTQSEIASATPK